MAGYSSLSNVAVRELASTVLFEKYRSRHNGYPLVSRRNSSMYRT